MEEILKIEAAKRQLNTAIRLLFQLDDAIAIHSLAVSAANIFSDIAEQSLGKKSWREMLREDNKMSLAEVKKVFNHSWNFFKHADKDPHGVLIFDPAETEHIIFISTLECAELAGISIEMQVFQLWFLAVGKISLEENNEIQTFSKSLFPNLDKLSKNEQLSAGYLMLMKQKSNISLS